MRFKDLTTEQRSEYFRQKHKEYRDRNRDKYREKIRKAYKKFMLKAENREKMKQRNDLHNPINELIRKGEIIRDKCLFCKNPKTEAHHQNRKRPLDVKWMCKHCHELYHQLLREINIKL